MPRARIDFPRPDANRSRALGPKDVTQVVRRGLWQTEQLDWTATALATADRPHSAMTRNANGAVWLASCTRSTPPAGSRSHEARRLDSSHRHRGTDPLRRQRQDRRDSSPPPALGPFLRLGLHLRG